MPFRVGASIPLIQAVDGDQRLVPTDVGGTVELPPDIRFADAVGVEGSDVQAVGMAQGAHRNVQACEARRHLRAVAAHADQMHRNAAFQQPRMNQVFHQRLQFHVLPSVSRGEDGFQALCQRRTKRSTQPSRPAPGSPASGMDASASGPCHGWCGSDL